MMWANTSSRSTVGSGTPSRACRVISARLVIGRTVRQALQRRTDRQRDVFRRGRCAEYAQVTHGVVATPHAIDQAGLLHAPEKICGGCVFDFPGPRAALGDWSFCFTNC